MLYLLKVLSYSCNFFLVLRLFLVLSGYGPPEGAMHHHCINHPCRMTPHHRLLLQNCTTFIHLRLLSFYFTFGFTPPPPHPSLPSHPPPPHPEPPAAAAVGFCTGKKTVQTILYHVVSQQLNCECWVETGLETDTSLVELVSFTFHWSSCHTQEKEADLFG